jgi:hypothetical protein
MSFRELRTVRQQGTKGLKVYCHHPSVRTTMMRTFMPTEPELVQLCRSRTWVTLTQRLQSHPVEATPSDASLRGEGSTTLSVAVRSSAPRHVVKALLQANLHQIGITHRNRGSILHEALKHRASDDVLEYLLQTMIQYQESLVFESPHQYKMKTGAQHALDPAQFRHISVQSSRLVRGPSLLGVQDDLGRTALHYLVERAKRVAEHPERSSTSWGLFRTLSMAHPESIQIMDSDGNTPLVLLLLAPRESTADKLEADIYRMVEHMVSICPSVVTISRKMPRPFRFLPMVGGSNNNSPLGDGAPTPLYYALLNRRSSETVSLLIRASHEAPSKGCATIVSQYQEVCLHVAITTRAPLPVLYQVLNDFPEAVLFQDIYGLSSVDWLWIRHVLEWNASPLDAVTSRMISRRRFLGSQFMEWHEFVSKRVVMDNDHHLVVDPTAVKQLQDDLYQRMQLMLPVAAAVMTADPPYKQGEPWSLLHSACLVSCPAAMLHVVLKMEPTAYHAVRSKDLRAGRYPLHYAATRIGYSAYLPIGVSRGIQILQEVSPVHDILPLCPEVCRATDAESQLPLHIAIDTARLNRATTLQPTTDDVDAAESKVLHALVSQYPDALERRDGKTKLFPWQQAAVGPGASINTIYSLLRRQPTLVDAANSRRSKASCC